MFSYVDWSIWFILCLVLISLVLVVIYDRDHKKMFGLVSFPLYLFICHALIFYILDVLWSAKYIGDGVFSFTSWSRGLRIHEFFTLVLLLGGVLIRSKIAKKIYGRGKK